LDVAKTHHEKVSRISFSLPPGLQEEFDEASRLMGYDERSKALQIAIRNMVGDYELRTDPDSLVAGGILLLYDHSKREIDHDITEIGHDYTSVIASSTHVHLDETRCLNITTVRGRYRYVLKLEQGLRKLEGIEQLKSTYFVVGK
jgi:CopG family transcriptional regulator, nickel-responsive regulator